MDYLTIIIITFISGVIGTGLGGLIGAIFCKNSNKVVSLLLSFAGGVMIAVVCFDLITSGYNTLIESVTNKNDDNNIKIVLIIVGAIFSGYLIVWALNKLIDNATNKEVEHTKIDHPETADDLDELIHSDHLEHHKKTNKGMFIAGLVMVFAIALHNLPEGMVIGASYAKYDDLAANLFTGSGFIMALIIGLHNIPEGMAVSVPLISGGMKKINAVLLTALSGVPIIIGTILGYALGGLGPFALAMSLGLASGAMLYVVFGELLPEAILMWKSKLPAFAAFIGILLGFILVAI